MTLNDFLMLAILVEAIAKIGKEVHKNNFLTFDILFPIIIGILCALYTNMNIFYIFNIPVKLHYDWIGNIFTGIIISRGANFIHDIFDSMKGINLNLKDPPKDN